MISVPLHDNWTLRSVAGPVPQNIAGLTIPATVPGSVHTDLLDAGLISDPYVGLAEKSLEWVHTSDWKYTTTFDSSAASAQERIDLAFDGLDTVSRVVLNGVEVARTRNQHRYYRFDVTSLVRAGSNVLEVEFFSALNFARSEADRIGLRPRAYDHPFNMVRKMACSFGWDWGPDLQTAGLWKPVRLERWSVVRATSTRALVTVDAAGVGHVAVHMDLQWSDEISDDAAPVSLSAQVLAAQVSAAQVSAAEHAQPVVEATTLVAVGAPTAVLEFTVPDVELWWPAGYGKHPLYNLAAQLMQSGSERATYERRIGFRTVEVNTTPDQYGTPFTISVNGVDVFAKGANWIPDDHLLTRITREQLEVRVDQALASNMNMLRIWGGGIYESEDFYDVCDERGVMVWQDFLLACGGYPEDEPFLEEFTAEARDNVARLTPHASLVLWNGGNENLWGFMDWGWQEELAGLSWGLGLYTGVFADAVAQLDPTRFYADGSPYSPGFTQELSSGTTRVHPNEQAHGTRHEWEVWNRQDHLTHLDYVPRFCSEFGHQGPPAWSTLERSVSPEGRAKDTEEFLLHQKAEVGNFKLDNGAAPHLPLPADFEEWNWVTQLSQAHSVQFGIEHFRSFWPYTAGSLVWQLNDCWPVTSWAAVDGDGREKPLFYALKHAHAPRLMSFKPRAMDANEVGIGGVIGGGEGSVVEALGAKFGEDLPHGRTALGTPTLFLHNDSSEVWAGTLRLVRFGFTGEILAEHEVHVSVEGRAGASINVPANLLTAGDPRSEVLVADLAGVRAFHYFAELKDLALEPHPFAVSVADEAGQAVVTVQATALVIDLAIIPDRVHPDLTVDDQLVTLLPGEQAKFVVSQRSAYGRKEGIGEPVPALTTTEEIVGRIEAALADAQREHTVVRAVNTIRV